MNDDKYGSELGALNSVRPAGVFFDITPSDTKDLYREIRGIVVAVAGAVRITPVEAYTPSDFKVMITNGAETISESTQSGGEIYAANGGAVPAVGDIFEVLGTGDFKTVQDLATAKGSAVAAGDRFIYTDVGVGTEAVDYLDGTYIIPALLAGQVHHIRAKKVWATSTAATGIVGIV